MRKILKNIKTDELIDFIDKYAASDEKFANAIVVRFCKPEFTKELSKIQNWIKDAFKNVSNYHYHDSWLNVDINTEPIISEIRERAEQGHIRLAFTELEMLYCKLLENFEFQGECEISDEADYCIEIMSEIADKAISIEDKNHIFYKCIELSEIEDGKDYGAYYEDKLLKIAVKFVTLENRHKLEQALSRFNSTWQQEKFSLINLELIEKFESVNNVSDFIAQNLHFTEIREVAFNKALSRKDFNECEYLCNDILTIENKNFGISSWLYKLYSVYELTENKEGLLVTVKKILLRGDLNYYEKLKVLLLEEDAWHSQYPKLLIELEKTLHLSKYFEILSKEKEYELLLEQLKKHTTYIYSYGELLGKKYPTDICTIFIEQINKEAEIANNRQMYNKVCNHISSFAKTSYTDKAVKIIDALKIKNKRRTAFIDELSKIKLN